MPKRTKRDPVEEFLALSDANKEKAVAEFDKPFAIDKFGPPPASARAQLRRARAKASRGRPKVGRGAARILISIERGLLQKADKAAKDRRMSRSQLVAQGLRTILSKAG